MKLWILDENTDTHRIVRFSTETHSELSYFGDLDDEEIKNFIKEINPKLDFEHQLKLLKYFGYLHMFVGKKKKED